jgi:hypothetical protein
MEYPSPRPNQEISGCGFDAVPEVYRYKLLVHFVGTTNVVERFLRTYRVEYVYCSGHSDATAVVVSVKGAFAFYFLRFDITVDDDGKFGGNEDDVHLVVDRVVTR